MGVTIIYCPLTGQKLSVRVCSFQNGLYMTPSTAIIIAWKVRLS